MENVANVVNALAQIGNPRKIHTQNIPHASELLLIDELESLFWTSFVEWMIEYCPSDPGHGAKSIHNGIIYFLWSQNCIHTFYLFTR